MLEGTQQLVEGHRLYTVEVDLKWMSQTKMLVCDPEITCNLLRNEVMASAALHLKTSKHLKQIN